MSTIVEKYGERYAFIKELKQESVLEIYKACVIAKEDVGKNPDDEIKTKVFTVKTCGKDSPEVTFSKKQISQYTDHIKYLLGQLKVVHDRVQSFTLPMGFVNYQNQPWTKDNTTLMALYYLGVANRCLPQFARIPDSNHVASNLQLIRPSVSPSDPVCEQTIEKAEKARLKAEWDAFVKSEAFDEMVDKIMAENEKKIREILEKARNSVRYWESRTMEDIIPDAHLRSKIRSNWKLKREFEKEYSEELQRRRKQLAELEERAKEVGIE